MQSVADQIKEKIDIVEFISGYVQLRKAGRSFVGLCPFHPNTRTPAFNVFPDTQSFHCFGCKASGTVFDFLMRREGLEFKDALEQLARRAGIELRERTSEEQQLDALRTRLLEVNAAAATFFRHMLIRSERGEIARAYVAKRAIDDETSEAFLLGYGPDDWTMLLSYLTDRKGFAPEEAEAAGLAIRHETRGLYDRFRNRLIFPIRNVKGEVVGFGGRALGDAQPKYMNSPQTPLFDKSTLLYGLDLARDAIRTAETVVVVEGYVDVIIAHQHGFRNVVAPLGTSLTAEHVGLVKKLARTVYLALDADAAGVRATLKGLRSLQEAPEGELTAISSPQGIVGWQRKLEVEIKILELPEGRDPDEVIRERPETWRELLAKATPAMDFYIRALTTDLDITSGKGKADAVERLVPLLAQVGNPVEQAHYIQQLARLLQIDEKLILAAMAGSRPLGDDRRAPANQRTPPGPAHDPRHAPRTQNREPRKSTGAATHEEALLGWLLRYPAARAAVEEKLRRDLAPFPIVQEMIAGTVDELLTHVELRAVWEAWRRDAPEGDPQMWASTLDGALAQAAQRSLGVAVPQSQSYRYVNDALECATILQQTLAKRWMNHVARDANEADDGTARATSLERFAMLTEYLSTISTPRRSSTYTDLHTLHTA
jgi:DNA primase